MGRPITAPGHKKWRHDTTAAPKIGDRWEFGSAKAAAYIYGWSLRAWRPHHNSGAQKHAAALLGNHDPAPREVSNKQRLAVLASDLSALWQNLTP
jgi:hypothetical protein